MTATPSLEWWRDPAAPAAEPTCPECARVQQAFLKLCEALGIQATSLAYLDGQQIARRAKLYTDALALGKLK